jgi:hypothetical protein
MRGSVVATAIAMPIMPNRLPCRLMSGMRQPAQRQDEQDAGDEIELARRDWRSSCAPFFFFLVHAEHALGDQEAAEDVDRGEDERDEAERARQIGPESSATSATPTASSAPTTITEEIALVTDISGVCSAGVTDQTT